MEEFSIVGEASDGREALEKVKELLPDVVVMDVNLKGMSGIETTGKITKRFPQVKVVMLSAYYEREYIEKSAAYGAKGYLTKNAEEDEFTRVILAVANGEESLEMAKVDTSKPSSGKANLTTREIEILTLIAQGLTTKDIAEQLYISPKTVNNHRTNILTKLKAKNSIELVMYAIKQNIISI